MNWENQLDRLTKKDMQTGKPKDLNLHANQVYILSTILPFIFMEEMIGLSMFSRFVKLVRIQYHTYDTDLHSDILKLQMNQIASEVGGRLMTLKEHMTL
jgi:hypothetical protein